MQYKIPVKIENEDPIFLGLSLRKIIIIMIGGGIGYSLFKGLSETLSPEIAVIPGIIIFGLSLLIAIFHISEMTFIPFVLAGLRYKINSSQRLWVKGVDSFSGLDIGYVSTQNKKSEKVDFGDKLNKIKNIDEQLEKI